MPVRVRATHRDNQLLDIHMCAWEPGENQWRHMDAGCKLETKKISGNPTFFFHIIPAWHKVISLIHIHNCSLLYVRD